MSDVLIVLTNKYPFGKGETFIEPERNHWKRFEHTFICPVLVRKEDKIREQFICGQNETVIESFDEKPGVFNVLNGCFRGFITIGKMLSEIKTIKDVPALFKIKMAFATAIYTNLRIKRIINALSLEINKLNEGTSFLVYSYWMFEPALVGCGLKETLHNCRFITRAHGYDVYAERHINKYIPYRKMVFEKIDAVYPISEDGKEYLRNEYNREYSSKVKLSRLGTIKKYPDFCGEKNNGNTVTIVSCAYLVPLKRIHLIPEALKMSSKDIFWVHFGGGELFETIEKSIQTLPNNIHVRLMGSVSNDEIQEYYSTHYVDAFVNVSEIEGIPVSIMEAQSFGIPVIATDVGGTSELVVDRQNGVLLKKDFQHEELLKAIDLIMENARMFRKKAKSSWDEHSNAEINYRSFFDNELAEINK